MNSIEFQHSHHAKLQKFFDCIRNDPEKSSGRGVYLNVFHNTPGRLINDKSGPENNNNRWMNTWLDVVCAALEVLNDS